MQSPTLLAIRRTIIVMGRKRRLFVSSRNMTERKQSPSFNQPLGRLHHEMHKALAQFLCRSTMQYQECMGILAPNCRGIGLEKKLPYKHKALVCMFCSFLTLNKNLYLSFDTTYYASFNPNHGLKFYQYFGKIS